MKETILPIRVLLKDQICFCRKLDKLDVEEHSRMQISSRTTPTNADSIPQHLQM